MDSLVSYLETHTPGGSQTGSKAPGKAGPRGGGYPAVLSHGHGAFVVDANDKHYCDYICSLAAVGLGHANHDVVRAVERQLRRGSLLSLPTLLEGQASEELCKVTGWAEQARWVKTGSEATEAAVRIARCATGRDKILTIKSGYHAWHAWFQAVKPQHPGVPEDIASLIHGLDYGFEPDFSPPDPLGEYACVILEPAPITGGGDAAWLKWLVDTAHAHGTLVIFDEVVWGFRLARAGGTEYFGVQPDLACYGKALGNGIPVGAVVGKRDLMQHARLISGTFGGDTLGLAAAMAVMHAYEEKPVVETMWERGSQLCDGFNAINPLLAVMTGYPVHPVIKFSQMLSVGESNDAGSLPSEADIMSLFLQELAVRGQLFHPAGLNITYTHRREHIDRTLVACEQALEVVSRALQAGSVRQELRGEPYVQAFARATT